MILSYYPEEYSNRADWWFNILTTGTPIFSELTLDANIQGRILRDATWAVMLYRTVPETFEQLPQALTGYCDSLLFGPDNGPTPTSPLIPAFPTLPPVSCPTGIEARRPEWVQTVKSAAGYNPLTHGIALRLEPTGTPFEPGNYTAAIRSLKATGPGQVELKLDKARGNITSNCVYGRKTGTATFLFMGKFNAATALVTVPGMAPGALEEWEFFTRGVVKDQEVGNSSPHESVIVKG